MDVKEAFGNLIRNAAQHNESVCLDTIKKCPEVMQRKGFPTGTFLHWCASTNMPLLIDFATNYGVDSELLDENGDTAICSAADYGSAEAADVLLRNGANPNHNLGSGPTPIMNAVLAGSLDVTNLLLKWGADVNASYIRHNGRVANALAFAEEKGFRDIAELLLAHGATNESRSNSIDKATLFL